MLEDLHKKLRVLQTEPRSVSKKPKANIELTISTNREVKTCITIVSICLFGCRSHLDSCQSEEKVPVYPILSYVIMVAGHGEHTEAGHPQNQKRNTAFQTFDNTSNRNTSPGLRWYQPGTEHETTYTQVHETVAKILGFGESPWKDGEVNGEDANGGGDQHWRTIVRQERKVAILEKRQNENVKQD